MKKILLIVLCFFLVTYSFAQYTVNIIVTTTSNIPDTLFIAGNFNVWNPAATGYSLQKQSTGKYSLQLKNVQQGNFEFKFTRGSWAKVECGKNGSDVSNHSLQLLSDTTVEYSIEAWKDAFVVAEIKHTACSHVKIIDTAFLIPQLNRTRRIWIYLPEGYATSKTRYPVLYLQDGQNVFDAATSFAGEWGVDEILDSLIARGTKACIVVGIDNGANKRMNEYNPYDNNDFGKGEGDEYVDFIANVLKPFIDNNYRTQKDKPATMIAGSSMGGLISYYALVKYPNVFGAAGVFSPSFWVVPGMEKMINESINKVNAKIFFYAGDKEDETMVKLMDTVADKLGQSTQSIIYKVVDPEGKHNESTWKKWFPEFYQWIIGEGYDGRIKAE